MGGDVTISMNETESVLDRGPPCRETRSFAGAGPELGRTFR